jgi:Mce-associated membrane protein
MNPSWYDLLDVDPTASADEIRVAWRAAVADLDPTDRKFRVFNQAAEVLLDPERRASYDAEVAQAAAGEDGVDRQEPDEAGEPDVPASVEPAYVGPVSEEGGREPWTVPGWLLIAVAFLLAVSLGIIGVSLTKPSDSNLAADTTAAQTAAERAIVPILSYDAEHLDQSASQAEQFMTDNEKGVYEKLFAVIRENAPRTGTVAQAKYVTSGIVRTGDGRVDVLVFVDQSTRNKQQTKPVIYKDQVTVSMEKVGNDWLVDDLKTSLANG